MALGIGTRDVYEDDFEKPFLKESREFYRVSMWSLLSPGAAGSSYSPGPGLSVWGRGVSPVLTVAHVYRPTRKREGSRYTSSVLCLSGLFRLCS